MHFFPIYTQGILNSIINYLIERKLLTSTRMKYSDINTFKTLCMGYRQLQKSCNSWKKASKSSTSVSISNIMTDWDKVKYIPTYCN